MDNLLNSILGVHCIFCGSFGRMICYICSSRFITLDVPHCAVCNYPSFNGNTHIECLSKFPVSNIFTSFLSEENVSKVLTNSKNPPNEFGAFEELIKYGVFYATQVGLYISGYQVVYMPYTKESISQMGYHPSHLIYKELKRVFGLKLVENENYEGKILLINDVFEKNDFALEFSKYLYTKGAKDIRIFTICRML